MIEREELENPGDSCIGACIALEVMPFLDSLGLLHKTQDGGS